MDKATMIKIALSAVAFVLALIWRMSLKHKTVDESDAKKLKKTKKLRTFALVAMLMSGWFLIGSFVSVFEKSKGIDVEFDMFAPHVAVLGLPVASTTVLAYIVLAVVAVLCVLFRLIAVPRFRDEARGLQSIMELAIESMDKFTRGIVGDLSDELCAYMFSVAVFLVGSAATELFGQRPPTSDLIMTFSLALITFVLINYYGIKQKKLSGRIKYLASPSPVIMPVKMLSDVAVPVSLSCRLFGNMLGGMIVMDLLKSALGGYSVGVTALAGLYFNLFHPLIQTYIFIILTLTFINEAAE